MYSIQHRKRLLTTKIVLVTALLLDAHYLLQYARIPESDDCSTKIVPLPNDSDAFNVASTNAISVTPKSMPVGAYNRAVSAWHRELATNEVVAVSHGCGQGKNLLLRLSSGSCGCARYRENSELINGELYSQLFADLLDINTTPLTAIIRLQEDSRLWSRIWQEVSTVGWIDGRIITITKYTEDLTPTLVPLLEATGGNEKCTTQPKYPYSLLEQWSEMLILDFITSNPDRLVNMLVNRQWHSGIMCEAVHNLRINNRTGQLFLLDNESGFYHGFRIRHRYEAYFEESLRYIHHVKPSTQSRLCALCQDGPQHLLSRFEDHVIRVDPAAHKLLPRMSLLTAGQLYNHITELVHKHLTLNCSAITS